MGQVVYGVVGAAIGYYFGGPTGAQYGYAIGSGIGAVATAPDITGPRLGDKSIQISSYGAAIPRVWGTDRISGTVIWKAPLREVESTESGKGGPKVTTYAYFASFAVALCEARAGAIRRIWAGPKIIYDVSEDAAVDSQEASLALSDVFVFYDGNESQMPDPTIEAHEGVGNVEPYRGTCYVVFTDMPVGDYGNTIPPLTFELSSAPAVPPDADVLEPLVVYDWEFSTADARPIHLIWGESGRDDAYEWNYYWTHSQPGDGPFTSSDTGFAATAAAFASNSTIPYYTAGANSVNWARIFHTDLNTTPSILPGGAGLEGDEHHAYLYSSAYEYGAIRDFIPYQLGVPLGTHTFQPSTPGISDYTLIWRLVHSGGGVPPAGYAWTPIGQILLSSSPYTLSTAWLSYVLQTRSLRRPGHDTLSCYVGDPLNASRHDFKVQVDGNARFCVDNVGSITPNYTWQIVGGTAKQLTAIEYRAGRLYQNAVGPVLLPGDPNYDNDAFWDAAFLAAVANGDVAGDVDYPVEVDEYAAGTAQSLPTVARGTVYLSEIVTDVCAEAGVSAGEIDVTELTDVVLGYTRTRAAAARGVLEPLRTAFYFDMVDGGDKIKFVKRGGAVRTTLGADDLAAGRDRAEEFALLTERAQEAELPLSVAVSYKAIVADYQPGVQYARRGAGETIQQSGVEVAVVLDDAKAAQIAEVVLYDAWASRNKRTISTTRKHTRLEPTDVIAVEDGARTHRCRIIDKTEDDGLIKLELRDDDLWVFDSTRTGVETSGGSVQPTFAYATVAHLMDLPLLRMEDENPGFYVAARGIRGRWRGARLYEEIGGDYSALLDMTRKAVIGETLNALPAPIGPGNGLDSNSYVDVKLVQGGELASTTLDLMLAGANAALVGDEIITFQTAELAAPLSYRLSGLLRGRLGTEQHWGEHSIGDRFVLLTLAELYRQGSHFAARGAAANYKAVTYGAALEMQTPIAFTNNAAALMPLSPVHLDAVPTDDGGLYVSWQRRTRYEGAWLDGADVPLGEVGEFYDVELVDGSTVVASQRVSVTNATFAGSDMSSSNLTVRVTQISAVIGRGFPTELEL